MRREGDGRPSPAEDLSEYQVVRVGDLVMNQLGKPHGSIGVSPHEGIISPAYFVASIGATAVPRFVHHLLRTRLYISEYQRRGKNMPPSQFDISWEKFRSIDVLLPSRAAQRAIADFLDTETARIDALVARKKLLQQLLNNRLASVASAWVTGLIEAHGELPLRRWVLRIEQGWSPVCGSEPAASHEWGVLKTSAVSSGSFSPWENKRLPDSKAPERRWEVRDGDLLMTRGSGSKESVGQAVVAHPVNQPLMISDLIYRVVLELADAPFLAEVLRSPYLRQQIQGSIRADAGQTLKLRADDILDLRVPAVPLNEQHEALTGVRQAAATVSAAMTRLDRQRLLLQERRQALITAAVTGELAIPGAAA